MTWHRSLNTLAIMADDSTATTQQLVTNVEVNPETKYYFSCKVGLKNLVNDKLFHNIHLVLIMTPQTGQKSYSTLATMPGLIPDDGLVELGGDFITLESTVKMTIYAKCDDGADFEAQNPMLSKIIPNLNWKEQANKRIEQKRKGKLNIKVTVSEEHDPAKVHLKLVQKKHAFPFGTSINSTSMFSTAPKDVMYQEFVYKYFNWATLTNAMKWRFMEPIQGKPNFYTVEKAIDALLSHGLKVRGHCITWGKSTKIMPWLRPLDPEGVRQAVTQRIEDLADKLEGKCAHYDVNNELLHGQWYENATQDIYFTDYMFKTMKSLDKKASLCLNDYEVCSSGGYTSAYARQAANLKKRGVPISYMGIQSHMSVYPDVDILTKRLQVLSEAKVPLFITELDVRQEDMEKRGQGYEDILRLYFSHPNVYGIVIWGFWENNGAYEAAALVQGKDEMKWNAAGQKFHDLIFKEWMTNEELTPEDREQTFKLKGFHGDYDLQLFYDGELQWTHEVTLEKGKAVNVDVTV